MFILPNTVGDLSVGSAEGNAVDRNLQSPSSSGILRGCRKDPSCLPFPVRILGQSPLRRLVLVAFRFPHSWCRTLLPVASTLGPGFSCPWPSTLSRPTNCQLKSLGAYEECLLTFRVPLLWHPPRNQLVLPKHRSETKVCLDVMRRTPYHPPTTGCRIPLRCQTDTRGHLSLGTYVPKGDSLPCRGQYPSLRTLVAKHRSCQAEVGFGGWP